MGAGPLAGWLPHSKVKLQAGANRQRHNPCCAPSVCSSLWPCPAAPAPRSPPGSPARRPRPRTLAPPLHRAADNSEPQSFYLKELQRYKQAACEGSSGDRPLVK